MLGLSGSKTVSRIPPLLHRAVLRVLRPAESAVRRLIVMAARGIVVKLSPSRPMSKGRKIGKGGGTSRPAFQLFDPRKRFKPVRVMKFTRLNRASISSTTIPGWRPCFQHPGLWLIPRRHPMALWAPRASARRLQALKLALEDLPRQAKRLARWQLKRKAAPDLKFLSPLRPGRPPGYRRKPLHEVDEVLTECDRLAWDAMKPDTS